VTTRLDQQLGHSDEGVVIFDAFGQPGVAPSPATSRCTCCAKQVSDVLVHDEAAFRGFRWGRSNR
jgi:hypothetical protein